MPKGYSTKADQRRRIQLERILDLRVYCQNHTEPKLCVEIHGSAGDQTFYCKNCKEQVVIDWWTVIAFPKSSIRKTNNTEEKEKDQNEKQ